MQNQNVGGLPPFPCQQNNPMHLICRFQKTKAKGQIIFIYVPITTHVQRLSLHHLKLTYLSKIMLINVPQPILPRKSLDIIQSLTKHSPRIFAKYSHLLLLISFFTKNTYTKLPLGCCRHLPKSHFYMSTTALEYSSYAIIPHSSNSSRIHIKFTQYWLNSSNLILHKLHRNWYSIKP